MKFHDAEAYLYSLGNEVSAMKLGLEAMRTLLTALGEPQNKYLKVQVAGTNGKGSVCAFLDSICNAAEIKTGTFTSPHLVSITERVRINGVDISEDEFAKQATVVRETAERLVANGELGSIPTFFEQVTAIALLAFADTAVEVAILETGLGGRLDATTAANAEIAAITRIDLDHQEYLGHTIEEIAAEKAAIIHERSRVVIGKQRPDAIKTILDRCTAVETVPKIAGERSVSDALGLRGHHQTENAAIATAIVALLRDAFTISDADVALGLRDARHPGRLEYQGRYLFDGAHNLAGTRALAEYLDEFEHAPITLVFGAMSDKPFRGMLEILAPRVDKIILTKADNERSVHFDGPLALAGISSGNVFITDEVKEALSTATSITRRGTILITGSLYLVGEAMRNLKK